MKSLFMIVASALALSSAAALAQKETSFSQGEAEAPVVQKVERSDAVVEGKRVAFDRRKGNCLACHMIDGGEMPGMSGPPLMMMKLRYPEPAKLRVQIWDATIRNPKTRMPPFGRHAILTEQEIDNIVEYLYSL